MTEVMKTATTVANVCARASLATGGPREGERALGGGGGGAGMGKTAWTCCGKRERRGVDIACLCVCVCVCVCSFHGFLFSFLFFFDLLQQFFLTFRPDCGFIL